MTKHKTGAATLELILPGGFPVIGDAHPLRRHYVRRLYLAFSLAATWHLLAFSMFLLHYRSDSILIPKHTFIVHPEQIPPPPQLNPRTEPAVSLPQLVAPSTVGIPEPVADFRAEALTIPDIGEISRLIGTELTSGLNGGASDSFVVQLPPGAGSQSPLPGEFVAFEEKPILIDLPAPVYPEMARNAEVEGTVQILVLVGKDGRVKDARAGEELPMLREAALAAARQAVFRPALQQHRPVEVWVQMPMRFSLH
jgi:periplasmic protein TonB